MNIELTLKYLLTHHDPFICLMKGRWGVGKTFFVKKFVKDNCSEVAKPNFSYVSLFGISSIDELVQAIFVNSVSTETLDTTLSSAVSPSSDEVLKDRAKYLFNRAKPLLVRAGNLPIFGVSAMRGFALGNLAHFSNRNSLIVIDDLERHSNSLSIRDILGILTNLKEERGCQIIIVMNEDALQKDGGDKPYFETKEKVIDREIVFQPTVEDAIEIGLSDKERTRAAAENCLKLQIGNIRTIQKVGSALRQLRDLLAEIQVAVPESFDLQLQTTTVLAAWAYWERIIDVDDLEKLEIGDSTLGLMDEADAKLSRGQKDLYQRVREYGYSYSDDTDKMIIRLIKTGAIEKDELRLRVQENNAAAAKRQRGEAMERAWEVYRGTLRPNNEEVVAALYEAHVLGIEDVQTSHLAQAVWVLRELEAEEKADDLMDRFFGRASPIDTYSSYPFKEMLQDHTFLERWKDETEREVPDERTLDQTIESYYNDKSNAMDYFKRLAQFSEDEFYDWFRTTTNPKVLAVASALSHVQYRLPLAMTEIATIESDVLGALRRISCENKISQIRLRHLFANEVRGQDA